MNCLDSEQIIALALASGADVDLAAERAHVGACGPCAARLEKVQQQLGRLETAMTWFDRDHAAEREGLLAALANLENDLPLRSERPWIHKVKEILTMPRTWIGSAAAAALLLAFFLLWNGAGTPPLLAQTAQALREVKSYQCRVTSEDTDPAGKKDTATSKWYWAEPGSFRWDMYQGDRLTHVQLSPSDKPGLEIDHRAETYSRIPPRKGALSPVMILSKLAGFAGQADGQLDARTIKGIRAPGFEIALTKIDPDIGNGTLRLWTDPKTKLPLRAEAVLESVTMTMIFEDFEWNVTTDNWFTVEPPARYQDKTPAPADEEEITKHIIIGFKTFAKYCGGRYPQAKMVYGDVTSEELNRNAGLPPRSPPTDKALGKVYSECLKAYRGYGWINELQRHDAGAIYHGKTVGPQDKNKVLFRWTLNDGRFRVIYGDLRVEDVTAARLKKLEAN